MSLNRAHITLIRQAFDAIGTPLPKPVAKALADRDKLAALPPVTIPTQQELGDAVAACLLDGRDPLEDEQCRRFAVAATLGGGFDSSLTYVVEQAAERRVVAALRESVDAILATLVTDADRASKQLTDAHTIIGDHDLAESEPILRLGPEAARAWAEARDAVDRLRLIDRAWIALANLTAFASTTAASPTLRLADLDLDQLDKIGRKADPWTIVRAGVRIELADATTIRERTGRIVEAQQDREDGRRHAARDAWRRQNQVVIA